MYMYVAGQQIYFDGGGELCVTIEHLVCAHCNYEAIVALTAAEEAATNRLILRLFVHSMTAILPSTLFILYLFEGGARCNHRCNLLVSKDRRADHSGRKHLDRTYFFGFFMLSATEILAAYTRVRLTRCHENGSR